MQIPSDLNRSDDNRKWWRDRHQELKTAAAVKSFDVAMYGDSITQILRDSKNQKWIEYCKKRMVLNAGISGDTTKHLSWRIDNGLEVLKSKVSVLLIGTNNIEFTSDSAEQIAQDILCIARKILNSNKGTSLIVCGILPRGEHADDPCRIKAEKVNKILSSAIVRTCEIQFVDFRNAFIRKEDRSIYQRLMTDFLHLSDLGYNRWLHQLIPIIEAQVEIRTKLESHAMRSDTLVVGSSTIKEWKTAEEDIGMGSMSLRGFCYAGYAEAVGNEETILAPLDAKNVVMYFANDIVGSDWKTKDRSPSEAMDSLVQFVGKAKSLCSSKIVFCTVFKPPLRSEVFEKIDEFNSMAKKWCQLNGIVVAETSKRIERELVEDAFRGIHLTRFGYQLFGEEINKALRK